MEPRAPDGPGRRSPASPPGLDVDDITGIASLAEPTRRALYLYVRAQSSPVSRDEAAAGVGVPRHAAKFHLDKLVDDGLLETEYRRLSGRQGPGAGRPAKLYRRAARELAVMLPDRRYQLAGQLMAQAITDTASEAPPVAEALRGAARDRGHMLGDEASRRAGSRSSEAAQFTAVREVLDGEGYETRPDPAGLILANCPFRALSRDYTTVVCDMNLAIMDALLDRLKPAALTALLDPAEGRCCVRLIGRKPTTA